MRRNLKGTLLTTVRIRVSNLSFLAQGVRAHERIEVVVSESKENAGIHGRSKPVFISRITSKERELDWSLEQQDS